MNDVAVAARIVHRPREALKRLPFILIVDANARLYRHRNIHGPLHRLDTPPNMIGLQHETGPEAARLDPVARASGIEIDLIVSVIGANPGAFGKIASLRAAKLQGYRMLARS